MYYVFFPPTGDPTAVKPVINHFIFIKWFFKLRFQELKGNFLDHKMAARPQKRPELDKKHPKSPKNTFCSGC